MERLSPLRNNTAIVIAIVIAASAVLVAIFIPAQKLGTTEAAAMSNAKMLGLGCMQYSINHGGNYPPSLDALAPDYLPSGASLTSPLMPSNPIGYTYHPGLTDTSPADAILLEDKFDSRIVIRRDDSSKISASHPAVPIH